MSRSLNKVQLIGNLGADPEVRILHEPADVLARAVAEDLDRQPGAPVLVLVRLGEQLAHVVREAGDAEQAGHEPPGDTGTTSADDNELFDLGELLTGAGDGTEQVIESRGPLAGDLYNHLRGHGPNIVRTLCRVKRGHPIGPAGL